MGTLEGDAQRRASTTARRSFFRRKKHRDSKELASFSNTELGCWSDSGTLADDVPVLSYQRVERLHRELFFVFIIRLWFLRLVFVVNILNKYQIFSANLFVEMFTRISS